VSASAGGKVAAGVAATAVAAGFAQLLPATSSLRKFRNRCLPALAGVGTAGHVALTFDDGPDPSSTPAFLDALDSLGWRATFFMLGTMAAAFPDITIEAARRGHEVAVHGYSHSNHLRHGPRWVVHDVLLARDTIEDLIGTTSSWLRPPYGALSWPTLIAARRAGLRPVLWTTWGRDWRVGASVESIVEDVSSTLVKGATVLLHDSDCTSAPGSWKATLAALPTLAEIWATQGLVVGPLSEHGVPPFSLGEKADRG
jgi:peptidoglycan-N-acetylglucosamine deacetylase